MCWKASKSFQKAEKIGAKKRERRSSRQKPRNWRLLSCLLEKVLSRSSVSGENLVETLKCVKYVGIESKNGLPYFLCLLFVATLKHTSPLTSALLSAPVKEISNETFDSDFARYLSTKVVKTAAKNPRQGKMKKPQTKTQMKKRAAQRNA